MNYRDIIAKNCAIHSRVSWWPKFAYHCTNVLNAVNILKEGRLLSRATARSLNKMKNDNASRQVIELTDAEVVSHVRFYFRPKTQTYYHQEGFKHLNVRYKEDKHVNIPVPVFFLFDLEKLLSYPGVEFSEKTLAGRRGATYSGVESFSQLQFHHIYDNDKRTYDESSKYRQAEILAPDSFDFSGCLSRILCRNEVELVTLLNILKKDAPECFDKYSNIIKVYSEDTFFKNGLFVEACDYYDGAIFIEFYHRQESLDYVKKYNKDKKNLNPISVDIELDWVDSDMNVIKQIHATTNINYLNPLSCKITHLPCIEGAVNLGVRVYFEKELMCYVIHSLQDSELIE